MKNRNFNIMTIQKSFSKKKNFEKNQKIILQKSTNIIHSSRY